MTLPNARNAATDTVHIKHRLQPKNSEYGLHMACELKILPRDRCIETSAPATCSACIEAVKKGQPPAAEPPKIQVDGLGLSFEETEMRQGCLRFEGFELWMNHRDDRDAARKLVKYVRDLEAAVEEAYQRGHLDGYAQGQDKERSRIFKKLRPLQAHVNTVLQETREGE